MKSDRHRTALENKAGIVLLPLLFFRGNIRYFDHLFTKSLIEHILNICMSGTAVTVNLSDDQFLGQLLSLWRRKHVLSYKESV